MSAAAQPARPGEPDADIDVEDVSFSYPDGTRALQGVNLQIRHGERVAIVGQNGSGKSTLVRHFNGLLRPFAGSVRLGGALIGDRHVAEIARTVGIAFQNPDRQIFGRSVGAEVRFGARNLGVNGEAPGPARRSSAGRQSGLTGLEALNPYDLGYSRRKLLGIASILAMQTPVVVLDEPTTGQDARGFARVAAIVASLAAEGRTVIAISHDMRFVAESFGRVVVMRAGTDRSRRHARGGLRRAFLDRPRLYVPRAAVRGQGRSEARPRVHADRCRARGGPQNGCSTTSVTPPSTIDQARSTAGSEASEQIR